MGGGQGGVSFSAMGQEGEHAAEDGGVMWHHNRLDLAASSQNLRWPRVFLKH